jgi:sulfate permease, SulP family
VKGPVTDKLNRTAFMSHLTGKLFLSHHEAIKNLAGTSP